MIQLDTDTVVAFLNGNAWVGARLRQSVPDVRISAIVLAELLYGARASARPEQNLEKVSQFLAIAPPVPFDEACADGYANLRSALRRLGKPTGEIDALIAASALAHAATLVTHNVRHFESIPGLKLADWVAEGAAQG